MKKAIKWAIKKIMRGQTFGDMVTSWESEGSYLLAVGIGSGAQLETNQKVRRDEIGVKIYGRGYKIFKGREIWKEAMAIVEARRRGQASLFE